MRSEQERGVASGLWTVRRGCHLLVDGGESLGGGFEYGGNSGNTCDRFFNRLVTVGVGTVSSSHILTGLLLLERL